MSRIAIDAMGGDYAPKAIVEGSLWAAQEYDVALELVGKQDEIQKEIDIYDLLYQSVILNLPNKKVCGINCKGKEFLSEENMIDPRLEVFKNIQINPKK